MEELIWLLNRLRAYMFAKSQSPDMAPPGVRKDINWASGSLEVRCAKLEIWNRVYIEWDLPDRRGNIHSNFPIWTRSTYSGTKHLWWEKIYMMDVRKYLPQLRCSMHVQYSPWCQCECRSIWHKPLVWQIFLTRYCQRCRLFLLRRHANGLISVWEKQLRKERTFVVTLMPWNLWWAMVYTPGPSTSVRSPNVAKSKHRFWSMLWVWLTSGTSTKEG